MVLEEPQEMGEFGIDPVLQMRYLKHMCCITHSFTFFIELLLCARHYSRQWEYSMSKRDESFCPPRSLHSSWDRQYSSEQINVQKTLKFITTLCRISWWAREWLEGVGRGLTDICAESWLMRRSQLCQLLLNVGVPIRERASGSAPRSHSGTWTHSFQHVLDVPIQPLDGGRESRKRLLRVFTALARSDSLHFCSPSLVS